VSDDEARRFMAEHGHYTEDLAFWTAAADRLGSPVLDLGAAAGRVALALARAGHRVVAVDRSPAMLAELRRRRDAEPAAVRGRVAAERADLATLDLGRRFPLVVVAMNTLQVLVEPDDRARALRAIARHVAPGGELLFDVALPDPGEIVASMGVERGDARHRDPESGAELVHTAWYDSWDPATSTLEFTLRIRERAGGRESEVLRRHRVHLYAPEELEGLLAGTGLERVAVLGDWDGAPLDRWSERQIHRWRAAG
jgi:SAM-dependent methyltransferase